MSHNNFEYSDQKFNTEEASWQKSLNNAKRIIPVNKYLEKFNWLMFNPYLPGHLIDYFTELIENNNTDNTKIYRVYARQFFDLKRTAFFIDGYFKRRPTLAPFCQLIDQSVFMCLERDYAGAINCLIPIIEGSLRLYLINNGGAKIKNEINQKELLKALDNIKDDYQNGLRKYLLENRKAPNPEGVSYTDEQINKLLEYRFEFYDVWLNPLKTYLDKNFFFKTKNGTVKAKDKLSRNTILHAFNSDTYYTLENYLKLFNCITYLSYLFNTADPSGNTLIELNVIDIAYKWKAFEKVRAVATLITDVKSSVYEKYEDFNQVAFKEDFIEDRLASIFSKVSKQGIENKLKTIDQFFDEFVFKNKT